MPLSDGVDGVSLSTEPWHGTIIPATRSLRATSARLSNSCKLLLIVQSVSPFAGKPSKLCEHLTASLEVCTSCGASDQS